MELETPAERAAREKEEDHPVPIHAPLTPPPMGGDVVEAWGQYMEDFVPSMLLSFPLPARGHEVRLERGGGKSKQPAQASGRASGG